MAFPRSFRDASIAAASEAQKSLPIFMIGRRVIQQIAAISRI
jgi:hypothetical protein